MSRTTFGALIASIDHKIEILKALGLNIIRIPLNGEKWPSIKNSYKQYVDAGVMMAITYNWYQQAGDPKEYCITTEKSAAVLDEFLIEYGENVIGISVGNEEQNSLYYKRYNDPVNYYFPLLKACEEVCVKHNIPCTNGGSMHVDTVITTYRWLKENKNPNASWFLTECVPESLRSFADNPQAGRKELQARLDLLVKLWVLYGQLNGVPAVNVHCYFPMVERGVLNPPDSGITTARGIEQINNCVLYYAKKPALYGEVGFLKNKTELVTNAVNEFKRTKTNTVLLFSAPGAKNEVYPLNDEAKINTLGQAFVNANGNKK